MGLAELPRDILFWVLVSSLDRAGHLSMACTLLHKLLCPALWTFASLLPRGQLRHAVNWYHAMHSVDTRGKITQLVACLEIMKHGVLVGYAAWHLLRLSRGETAKLTEKVTGCAASPEACEKMCLPETAKTEVLLLSAQPPCSCEWDNFCWYCHPSLVRTKLRYRALHKSTSFLQLAVEVQLGPTGELVFSGHGTTEQPPVEFWSGRSCLFRHHVRNKDTASIALILGHAKANSELRVLKCEPDTWDAEEIAEMQAICNKSGFTFVCKN